MATPQQVADSDMYKKIRHEFGSLIPWPWYCQVYDALLEVLEQQKQLAAKQEQQEDATD